MFSIRGYPEQNITTEHLNALCMKEWGISVFRPKSFYIFEFSQTRDELVSILKDWVEEKKETTYEQLFTAVEGGSFSTKNVNWYSYPEKIVREKLCASDIIKMMIGHKFHIVFYTSLYEEYFFVKNYNGLVCYLKTEFDIVVPPMAYDDSFTVLPIVPTSPPV